MVARKGMRYAMRKVGMKMRKRTKELGPYSDAS